MPLHWTRRCNTPGEGRRRVGVNSPKALPRDHLNLSYEPVFLFFFMVGRTGLPQVLTQPLPEQIPPNRPRDLGVE